jgi:hypothetical protein
LYFCITVFAGSALCLDEPVSQVDPVALVLKPIYKPEASGGVDFLEFALRRNLVSRRYAMISLEDTENIIPPPEGQELKTLASEWKADLVIWSRLTRCRARRTHASPLSALPLFRELDWTKFLFDPTSAGGSIDCFLEGQIKIYSFMNDETVENNGSVRHKVEFMGSLQSRKSAIQNGMDKLAKRLINDLFEKP